MSGSQLRWKNPRPLWRRPLIIANLTLIMKEKEYLSDEGYALMGAAFEVHREIGGGLSEEIYQESLEWELGLQRIPF